MLLKKKNSFTIVLKSKSMKCGIPIKLKITNILRKFLDLVIYIL